MTLTADTGTLRELTQHDRPALDALITSDPVTHCFVASRLTEPDVWRHGDIWGWFENDTLVSAVHHGANLVPIATTHAARNAIIERATRMHRRCSSIVGPAEEVMELWRGLRYAWGPAREVRERQPVLVMNRDSDIEPDNCVRCVRPDEIDVLLPACIDMFTEEVGVSPVSGGSATAYRGRILDIIRDGRSFARIEHGQVIFKAEIGAVAHGVCQVQGVWVNPQYRGQGLSAPAMAAVVAQARESIAPIVSLYVNDFNKAARATYARVGFQQVGVFATVLF